MNLKNIKEILDSELPNQVKESLIIRELAEDKNVIPKVLQILDEERELRNSLISDSNLELSRALTILMDKKLDKQIRPFVIDEIKKHYLKWRRNIKSCFKIEGLP